MLLFQYDVRASIFGRPTTSQGTQVFSAAIRLLHESFQGDRDLLGRLKFRALMKDLNLGGGVRLIGAMEEVEVKKLLDRCISSLK